MSKKFVQIALMVAVSSVFFSVENYIPTPFPWVRLGLANILTLLSLKWWGLKEAIIVVILRVFLGTLISGKLFTPVFFLSLTGNVTGAIFMYFLIRFFNGIFSLTGISICGALVKNVTQILVVSLLYVRHLNIVIIFPVFMISSLISGVVVGVLSEIINRKVSKQILVT